jgi:hypothetical protein
MEASHFQSLGSVNVLTLPFFKKNIEKVSKGTFNLS